MSSLKRFLCNIIYSFRHAPGGGVLQPPLKSQLKNMIFFIRNDMKLARFISQPKRATKIGW
jgi:hypothetical protein